MNTKDDVISFKEYIVIYDGKEEKFDTYEDALHYAQKSTFADYVLNNGSLSLLVIRNVKYQNGGESDVRVDMRIVHWLSVYVCEVVKFNV
jgi:hypothetical protein